jgi:uncharacterized protein
MRWTDLAFLHWPVPAASLRRLLPRGLELDRYGGDAWVGVVPFRMENVRHRWLPPIPTAATFLEINVRTYVVGGGRPGVWFLSLDAESLLAVCGARVALNLPYFHARMHAEQQAESVVYESRRTRGGARAVAFRARYRPVGDSYTATPGSLEHWLIERYCLFGQNRSGRLYHLDVHHLPWPLRKAEAMIVDNTMLDYVHAETAQRAPLAHYVPRLDVLGWARAWID